MRRRWYDPFTGPPGHSVDREDGESGGTGRTPEPAAAVLEQLVDGRQWRSRLEGARIHRVWTDVAGPAVAEHVRPVRLMGGVLVLEADSGLWATQVRYLQQQLIQRANEVLGQQLVERIRITARTGPA